MSSMFRIVQVGKKLPLNPINPKNEGDEGEICNYYSLKFSYPTNADITVSIMYVKCDKPDTHVNKTVIVKKGNTHIFDFSTVSDWWCNCNPSNDGVYSYQEF